MRDLQASNDDEEISILQSSDFAAQQASSEGSNDFSTSIESGSDINFQSAGSGNPDEQFLFKIMEAQGIK